MTLPLEWCARGEGTWAAGVPAAAGAVRLECDGIAGIAEIACGGEVLARIDSPFTRIVVDLPDTGADRELTLTVTPPTAELARRRPRGRWRTTLTPHQSVRWLRTTMLGLAPFHGPVPAPLGPYRDSRLVPAARPRVRELAIDTDHDGAAGRLRLRAVLAPGTALDTAPLGPVRVRLAGTEVAMHTEPSGQGDGGLAVVVDVDLPGLAPWWPHVLGEPALHSLVVSCGGHTVLETEVGFRRLEVDLAAGPDGAGVTFAVGGLPLHARGVVWAPLDATTLRASPEDLRAAVRRARECGAVVLRIPGTGVYEEPAFWSACAREGMLVWQDLMLANVDPPAEEPVAGQLRAELRELLRDVAGSPSLAVLSGGSEILQQAEMSGRAPGGDEVEVLSTVVAGELERLRPGTPFVPSTPWTPAGHGAAIRVGAGVAHYFGVGGYRRPLADVRTADVRLAAECLAFAVPPLPSRVEALTGGARGAGHDPGWKAAVPRDRGASWDFEDVRDHYLREVYGVEPGALRAVDPERYLALGAGAVVEAMEEVLGWWRSPRSHCAGGLVLTARDLLPGAGCGMTDSGGVPKAGWYAARRRWAARALWVDDRGLDGLWVELHADREPDPAEEASLAVRCHGFGGALLHSGVTRVRGRGPWSVDEVLGACVDPGYALRFGPPAVACVEVSWEPAGGEAVREVWMPRPAALGLAAFGSTASGAGVPSARLLAMRGDGAAAGPSRHVVVSSATPARRVLVDAPGYVPSDAYFHLAPGCEVTVRLDPLASDARPPRPVVTADGVAGVLTRDEDPPRG